jgi:transcriptional regulator with XRE-family HTH domain
MKDTAMTLLDHELVRTERTALGISERDAAKQLGVTTSVIRALEAGTNHKDLPLGFIHRLADLLCQPVTQLLHDGVRATPPATETSGSDSTAAKLGATLATVGETMPIEAVAEAFSWTLEEVIDAAADLRAHLGAAGLTVHISGGDLALRPRDELDRDARQALLRRHHGRRGLDVGQVRILARVMKGELDLGKLGNDERVTVGELARAGIISLPITGDALLSQPAEVSADVDESLTIPERPEPNDAWEPC